VIATGVQGAGLGLRRELLGPLLDGVPAAIGFLEVAPENWMDMGGAAGRRFRELAQQRPLVAHGLSLSLGGPGPLDAEPPAHPQVGDQGLAPVEVGQQVLGPSPQGDHMRPGQALDEALGEGKPQVWPTRFHPDEAPPLKDGRQAAADGLDLGKLRHEACLARPRPPGNRGRIRRKRLSRGPAAF
jgi:hypothetical protein